MRRLSAFVNHLRTSWIFHYKGQSWLPLQDKLSDQDILVLTFWDNSTEQTKMLTENKRRKTCFLQGTLFQSCHLLIYCYKSLTVSAWPSRTHYLNPLWGENCQQYWLQIILCQENAEHWIWDTKKPNVCDSKGTLQSSQVVLKNDMNWLIEFM